VLLGSACDLSVCCLRGTAASRSSATTTTRLACEATTASSLATAPLGLVPATPTAGDSATTSRAVVTASVGIGLRPPLLHDDVLAVNGVRVGGHGGIVASLGLELNECAVLLLR
jgi:hypothetical protein